jgi:hypothetical protein
MADITFSAGEDVAPEAIRRTTITGGGTPDEVKWPDWSLTGLIANRSTANMQVAVSFQGGTLVNYRTLVPEDEIAVQLFDPVTRLRAKVFVDGPAAGPIELVAQIAGVGGVA